MYMVSFDGNSAFVNEICHMITMQCKFTIHMVWGKFLHKIVECWD